MPAWDPSFSRKVTSNSITSLQKSKSETECRLPDGHFHYCLLRPRGQYIYVTSSRVYINTSKHPINHFFLASTSLREVYAPHLSHCIFLSFSHYLFCVSSWPSCPSEMPQAARNFSLKVPKATGASDQKYSGFFPTLIHLSTPHLSIHSLIHSFKHSGR